MSTIHEKHVLENSEFALHQCLDTGSHPTAPAPVAVAAQTLLARTLGHAIGAYTQLVSGLANLFFPAALLAYGHVMGGLSLGACSKVLLAIMLATLVAKMAWEGPHTLPKYCPRRGKKVLGECTGRLGLEGGGSHRRQRVSDMLLGKAVWLGFALAGSDVQA